MHTLEIRRKSLALRCLAKLISYENPLYHLPHGMYRSFLRDPQIWLANRLCAFRMPLTYSQHFLFLRSESSLLSLFSSDFHITYPFHDLKFNKQRFLQTIHELFYLFKPVFTDGSKDSEGNRLWYLF